MRGTARTPALTDRTADFVPYNMLRGKNNL